MGLKWHLKDARGYWTLHISELNKSQSITDNCTAGSMTRKISVTLSTICHRKFAFVIKLSHFCYRYQQKHLDKRDTDPTICENTNRTIRRRPMWTVFLNCNSGDASISKTVLLWHITPVGLCVAYWNDLKHMRISSFRKFTCTQFNSWLLIPDRKT